MISWHRIEDLVSVAPDPRFISFEMFLGHSVDNFATKKVKSVAMSKVSEERDPEFFVPGSHANLMTEKSGDGTTELLTLADPHDVYINGSALHESSVNLFFHMKRCNRS